MTEVLSDKIHREAGRLAITKSEHKVRHSLPCASCTELAYTVLEEYRIGVGNGAITDPGEYQDAYGFTVVALEIAHRIDGKETAGLISDLESLLALWPEDGPLASSVPSPVPDLVAKTSQIHIALGTLQAER